MPTNSGGEACKLYEDARRMLDEIVRGGVFTAHGVCAFYGAAAARTPSTAKDCDVVLSDGDGVEVGVLRCLRQQVNVGVARER